MQNTTIRQDRADVIARWRRLGPRCPPGGGGGVRASFWPPTPLTLAARPASVFGEIADLTARSGGANGRNAGAERLLLAGKVEGH